MFSRVVTLNVAPWMVAAYTGSLVSRLLFRFQHVLVHLKRSLKNLWTLSEQLSIGCIPSLNFHFLWVLLFTSMFSPCQDDVHETCLHGAWS